MKELDVFVYQRKYYRRSIREISLSISRRVKEGILRAIFRTRFKNKLYPGDLLYLRKREQINQNFDETARLKYPDITLSRITFFEAVEIDDFDRYKTILLTKFKDDSYWRTETERERLRRNLANIKTSLDSVTYGGEIFYFEFSNKTIDDLIESAHVGYIKTLESYFILSIEIIPSKKFKTIYKKIIMSDDIDVETDIFNRFIKIIRTGIFVSHTSVEMSSISLSLKNLLDDLTHQVKINITDKFKGIFFRGDGMPRIDFFEVTDISKAQSDKFLARQFNRFHHGFSLNDRKVYVFPPTTSKTTGYRLRVLKEKGHGRRDNSGSDLTDYDWVETYDLLQSLSLPCTLDAILALQKKELNQLKRRVYDYINEHSKRGLIRRFLFLRYSQKYVDLKISLSKCILTFKRFQDEFDSKNLRIFSRDASLDIYQKLQTEEAHSIYKEADLQDHFQQSIVRDIDDLNGKMETLEHVFRPIEDLSIYRTNFWLQIISIFIAVLALILTLDKLWELVQKYLVR